MRAKKLINLMFVAISQNKEMREAFGDLGKMKDKEVAARLTEVMREWLASKEKPLSFPPVSLPVGFTLKLLDPEDDMSVEEEKLLDRIALHTWALRRRGKIVGAVHQCAAVKPDQPNWTGSSGSFRCRCESMQDAVNAVATYYIGHKKG